jgi:alpha/beta superfamily hydrolase
MKALNRTGFPVLRFNFRGVGLSQGEHGQNRGSHSRTDMLVGVGRSAAAPHPSKPKAGLLGTPHGRGPICASHTPTASPSAQP